MSIEWVRHALEAGPEDSSERFVYLAIGERVNKDDETGHAWPSRVDIISRTKLSDSTVRRCIASLEKAGWMEVRRGAGGPSHDPQKNVSHYYLRKVPSRQVSQDTGKGVVVKGERCHGDESKVSPCTAKGVMVTEPPHPLIGGTGIEPEWEPPTPAEPRLADEPGTFPEGLSELQYAVGVLEHCAIVDMPRIRDAAAKVIVLLARLEQLPKHRAAEELEKRVVTAQARGDTVNSFWFEDSKKWKVGGVNAVDPGNKTGAVGRVERTVSHWNGALAERRRAGALREPVPADAGLLSAPGIRS